MCHFAIEMLKKQPIKEEYFFLVFLSKSWKPPRCTMTECVRVSHLHVQISPAIYLFLPMRKLGGHRLTSLLLHIGLDLVSFDMAWLCPLPLVWLAKSGLAERIHLGCNA